MQKLDVSYLKVVKPLFYLPFLFFLITSGLSYSQTSSHTLDAFRDSISRLYGTNDLLVNGYPYAQPNPAIKEHPYLFENEWLDATLYMAGNEFVNQQVKYNLVDEILVLKAEVAEEKHLLVDVNKSLLDSFRIKEQVFVNSSLVVKDKDNPRYYQLIHGGEVYFVRKFEKKFLGTYSMLSPHGKYSSMEEDRYVIEDGEITRVNNRRSFIRFFPEEKRKKVRSYFREHSLNYSRASFKELVDLSEFCFN